MIEADPPVKKQDDPTKNRACEYNPTYDHSFKELLDPIHGLLLGGRAIRICCHGHCDISNAVPS